MLLANGASAKIRVRYNAKVAYEPEDGRTSPLLHLALNRDVSNFEIFRAMAETIAFSEFFERNSVRVSRILSNKKFETEIKVLFKFN